MGMGMGPFASTEPFVSTGFFVSTEPIVSVAPFVSAEPFVGTGPFEGLRPPIIMAILEGRQSRSSSHLTEVLLLSRETKYLVVGSKLSRSC